MEHVDHTLPCLAVTYRAVPYHTIPYLKKGNMSRFYQVIERRVEVWEHEP